MFDELSEKLEGIIRKLGGKVVLGEEVVDESLREIRRVLLEADVNYGLVQDFLASVREKATGQKVVKSVSPGQMMVKVVHDELVEMLGGSSQELNLQGGGMRGLQFGPDVTGDDVRDMWVGNSSSDDIRIYNVVTGLEVSVQLDSTDLTTSSQNHFSPIAFNFRLIDFYNDCHLEMVEHRSNCTLDDSG